MISLPHLLRSWSARYRDARTARVAARELARLGPEILADIGLPPHRLQEVAAELVADRTPPCRPLQTRPAAAEILAFPAVRRTGATASGGDAAACCAA